MLNIDRALKISGWMSPNELLFLAKLAKESKLIMEVGCYQGRSTRAMADNTKGVIYAIDPWNVPLYDNNNKIMYCTDDNTRNIFYMNLYDKIKINVVKMYPMKFEDFQRNEWSEYKPDLIFIDANHRYKDVVRDIQNALTFKPKIIAGHDYCKEWPQVIVAVDEIFPKAYKEETIWWQPLNSK